LTLIAKNNLEHVGLFGGSFDPIHLGHLAAAEFALSNTDLDRVVFVPVGKPWQKPAPIASATDRMNMLNLAIEEHASYSSWDYEITNNQTSYMIDTVHEFISLNSNLPLSLILGADAAQSLPTWHRFEELIQKIDVIVLARENQERPSLDFAFQFLQMPLIEVSSSQVRDLVLKDENIDKLVPEKVKDYIFDHKLYQ
jgi:nicotinate-nucleotide adenylyltransferase